MTYKITSRTEALVRELGQLAEEIESNLLSEASPDARREWETLRQIWPTPDHIRSGATTLSDDELAFMVQKIRRFRSILSESSAPKAVRWRKVSQTVPAEARADQHAS
jgi:hypothetical protein